MNNHCRWLAAGVLFASGSALGQESVSYKVTDYTFNVWVHPDQGLAPASASFKISLGAGNPANSRDAGINAAPSTCP